MQIAGEKVSDVQRFLVFMAASFVVFLVLLRFTVRKRQVKPSYATLLAIGFIIVNLGMVFARYSHLLFPSLSWTIYYGTPALATIFLPPIWLRMNWREVAQYLPLAWLTAPAIHLFFSFIVGWHDYMPFPVYIPSLANLIGH
jgi:hypothetical protein